MRTTPVEDVEDTVGEQPDLDDPQCIFEATVLRRVIHRNIARLSDRKRELLRLLFLTDVEGYAAISAILEMPVGSIGPTRRRALAKLRELLAADAEWDRAQPA
jgi:DNA-directed RNA polymerase specialized sigma24 family protein